MSSHRTPSEFVVGRRATPLGATLRTRWRVLTCSFLAITFVAFVTDWYVGVDAQAVVVATRGVQGPVLPVDRPVTELVFRLERATLVGLLTVAVTTPLAASRDGDTVRLRRGRDAFLLALAAGVAGGVAGHVIGVDATRAVLASGLVDGTGTGGRFWLAELAVSVPATWAVAFALPGAVVGAVRSGLVARRPTARQRWLAVLALLTFVAVYSPSDSVTFVGGAALVLSGLLVGLALVEYDVVSPG